MSTAAERPMPVKFHMPPRRQATGGKPGPGRRPLPCSRSGRCSSAAQNPDDALLPRQLDHLSSQRVLSKGERAHFTSTNPTSLLRLLASTGFPSRVTSILRTMSPPPGIAQLWNFSVAGSKRTIVFGLAPDSLYQTAPLVKTIPYGSDLGPLGDGHSVTLPVVASSRPKKPRAKSVYQIISSGLIAMRRGRAPALGSGYSVICMVLPSMLATLLVPKSTKNTTFLELRAIP